MTISGRLMYFLLTPISALILSRSVWASASVRWGVTGMFALALSAPHLTALALSPLALSALHLTLGSMVRQIESPPVRAGEFSHACYWGTSSIHPLDSCSPSCSIPMAAQVDCRHSAGELAYHHF
ncbi:hypothetical protein F5148DRAFT_1244942 [Russula earlei]|uniref:Uncharacterized protein n=1 Tax=Russula earlei TaxID=71964 RepID=A0ACC0TUY0_9AGAM|nr:hypothetical protein F5148DRAFT_1244942 [Russula earlei]